MPWRPRTSTQDLFLWDHEQEKHPNEEGQSRLIAVHLNVGVKKCRCTDLLARGWKVLTKWWLTGNRFLQQHSQQETTNLKEWWSCKSTLNKAPKLLKYLFFLTCCTGYWPVSSVTPRWWEAGWSFAANKTFLELHSKTALQRSTQSSGHFCLNRMFERVNDVSRVHFSPDSLKQSLTTQQQQLLSVLGQE